MYIYIYMYVYIYIYIYIYIYNEPAHSPARPTAQHSDTTLRTWHASLRQVATLAALLSSYNNNNKLMDC